MPSPCCPLQVSLLQGKRHTWHAGACTLFNTHEIATMSGKAAWLGLESQAARLFGGASGACIPACSSGRACFLMAC